jgi:hypothetical protein
MTDSLIEDNDNPGLDPEKDYYNDLVGEGKKFRDNKALAYSKMNADLTIKIKDRMLDDMRRDLEQARIEAASRARVEDLLTKINNPSPIAPKVTTDETKPEINMTELESLVDKRIQQTAIQSKQQENLNMVKSELTKRFGDNLDNKLKEVGLDGESAAQLAKVNPQLVLKALGVERQPEGTFSAPPRNTPLNSTTRAPEQRTWSYYQKLFSDPKNAHLKYDPKINTQMQKDYIAIGQAFEDGDFKRFGETSFYNN